MKSDGRDYDEAKQLTVLSLQKFVETTEQLTHLSLPERNALIEEIARVVPAGNVPGLVSAGLATLPGRVVSNADNRRNLNLLMQGMHTFLDKAVFNTFFVGPARVLSAYQMMLKLIGKDVEQSFPEGTWQFYVEFGLREDSGRHACETVGFHAALNQEQIKLSNADELTTWAMASVWLLDRYEALLANEWTERVRLSHLESALSDNTLTTRWLKSRPYGVPKELDTDFISYRREAFEIFCSTELARVNPRQRNKIEGAWVDKQADRVEEMVNYQRQMTMLATLNPTDYSDTRAPIPRDQLCLGVIANGRYYLIDIGKPLTVNDMRVQCAAILNNKPDVAPPSLDKLLSAAHRRDQPALRRMLSEATRAELENLRRAPILLNWDQTRADEPLSLIRTGRRGIGDHAMTLFRTSSSMVFDVSHIFFDGPWAMAVAEVFTNQAIRIARGVAGMPKLSALPIVQAITLEAPQPLVTQARKAQLNPEASAETTLARLDLIQQARRLLQKRNTKLSLTINDILILYRTICGKIYQPSAGLVAALNELQTSNDPKLQQAASMAFASLEDARQENPSLLIPMDAAGVRPRERIFPTTFRNPIPTILEQHREALQTLKLLETKGVLSRPFAYRKFEDARRDYLGSLDAFVQIMKRYKDVSLQGESVSTSTIKLLAGLPRSVQRLLDTVPDHFDVVNDVVKGQEVFSNVGEVAISSSLTRFITAKDDNEKKSLAWGVMTDAKKVMHVSLRDFRPHVTALVNARQTPLAQRIAQEYVDAYAIGLNQFVEELARIVRARMQND